jgi:hypothetical protein
MRRKVPAFLLLLIVLLACHISEEVRIHLTSVSFLMHGQIDKSEKN